MFFIIKQKKVSAIFFEIGILPYFYIDGFQCFDFVRFHVHALKNQQFFRVKKFEAVAGEG